MPAAPKPAKQPASTETTSFGSGRREGHDSSPFYARFDDPVVDDDERISPPAGVDCIWEGDARDMDRYGEIADGSVALVVTSPPYFVGKDYETPGARGDLAGNYAEHLDLIADVLAECVRKLEPGGRIAVNVANLGRKPYRSMSADVMQVLAGRLGLLLRGEIIWVKAQGASGSCAWGSYRSPANPVLRDLTERIIVASKGRFDRALNRQRRAAAGLPHEPDISAEEFMESTTDLWRIPPESATRVGHPAPFPVALPLRLIRLYTYVGDLVLDPFMGSGSTAVAAARSGRRYVGFDIDPDYVAAAYSRAAAEGMTLFPDSTAAANTLRRSSPVTGAEVNAPSGREPAKM